MITKTTHTSHDQDSSMLDKAMRVHEPRLRLAALVETSCPAKAAALSDLIIRQASENPVSASMRKHPARTLLSRMAGKLRTMRREGALA